MKKIIALVLALTMVFIMCGCEASDIKKAKECVDNIYEYTNKLSQAKIDFSRDPDNDVLYRQVALYEGFVETETEYFESLYKSLSEKGQQEVSDYVAEAGLRNIANIWS